MKPILLMLGAVLVASSGLARANDHGCTVLLCLANPAGPMAVSECVPPIRKLYRDLARGKAFPTCAMASAPGTPAGKSWAQHGVSYYDQCPTGTIALEAGAYAMAAGVNNSYHVGIGEGEYRENDDPTTLPSKVCVGKRIGDATLEVSGADGWASTAGVFEHIVVLSPAPQRNHIDVYVDSTFLHRVRW